MLEMSGNFNRAGIDGIQTDRPYQIHDVRFAMRTAGDKNVLRSGRIAKNSMRNRVKCRERGRFRNERRRFFSC
jgi:hypothetical protein